MAIKLFVSDMDGTLLDSNRNISEKNILAIRRAVSDGMVFTISTGRMHVSALPHVMKLGLPDVPIITYNGALIKTIGGKEIYSEYLDGDVARDVLAFAETIGEYCQAYTKDELLYREVCEQSQFYELGAGIKGKAVGDGILDYADIAPKLLFISKGPEYTDGLVDRIRAHFKDRMQVLKSAPRYIEIMNNSVSKANAVRKLADMLGIDQSEILAIGDSDNDISMISEAGVGVAMGNANYKVKAVAGYSVSSNDEDGIAEAIEKYYFNK